MDHETLNSYSPLEERINIYSHALGAFLAFIAFILFVDKGMKQGTIVDIVSNLIFSLSMITLYGVSAKYHSETISKKRFRLKMFDHSSIYIFIAGTYTPFALSVIKGVDGWILFTLVWAMAVIGITLKLFFTGRFKIISTLMYVFMGWIIIFYINQLIATISHEGFTWLLAGGISYTIGAVIYSIKKVPFNHAIFHCFVLVGSISHFISIYSYI